MSFSDEVRREICTYITDKDKRFACLYGMLLFSRTVMPQQICFQSKNETSAETFGRLFGKVFHHELSCRESVGKNGRKLYIYDITSAELVKTVFEKYKITEKPRQINYEMISTGSLGVFAAGVFLACGSVIDPEKEYHLEFAVPEQKLAQELISLLNDIGVTARSAVRRGQLIVYIKGSEGIEDTLTFIGAQQCTLELMNVKIYKDVRNKANRIANCDSANIDKVVSAALKQIEDISLIANNRGLDDLPEELREIARLRMENPTMSLQEIGESLSEPLSRSGVNHRFKRIAKIADEIRMAGEKIEGR